jgi:5-methylcytosine-specific restriction enzyme subunit McrC
MLYASELFREQGEAWVSSEQLPDDLPDLLAEFLVRSTEKRLRRTLTHGFRMEVAEVARVRGRIDLLATLRRNSLERGRVVCRFESLTIDTPRNRLVRAALAAMGRIVARSELRKQCIQLERVLSALGVSRDLGTRQLLDQGRLPRHEREDRMVVSAAMLALQMVLPTEDAGDRRLQGPSREEVWARRLFERAVGGFYSVVLGGQSWGVARGKTLRWQTGRETARIRDILPMMETDIELEPPGEGRRLVIDTKFNHIVTTGWYREEAVRSAYVYQIYAYLRSQERETDVLSHHAAGLLLHPAINSNIDESVEIQGHAIRFATVDLSRPANEIRARLLELVTPVWEHHGCSLWSARQSEM